jgi:hypothetical protein
MQKWEFPSEKDMFFELGEEGWELASTSTYVSQESTGSNTTAEYFYFKRPKE